MSKVYPKKFDVFLYPYISPKHIFIIITYIDKKMQCVTARGRKVIDNKKTALFIIKKTVSWYTLAESNCQ